MRHTISCVTLIGDSQHVICLFLCLQSIGTLSKAVIQSSTARYFENVEVSELKQKLGIDSKSLLQSTFNKDHDIRVADSAMVKGGNKIDSGSDKKEEIK